MNRFLPVCSNHSIFILRAFTQNLAAMQEKLSFIFESFSRILKILWLDEGLQVFMS